MIDWLVAGLVAEATFAAFFPALRGEFVAWDDTTNFVTNLHYRELGLTQLHWMLTSLDGVWIPLTWLTFGLDYVLWGMRPAGYHLSARSGAARGAPLRRRGGGAALRRPPDKGVYVYHAPCCANLCFGGPRRVTGTR